MQRLVEKGKGIDGGDIVGVARDIVSSSCACLFEARADIVKPIAESATYGSLLSEVSDIGADLLVDVLRKIQAGTVGSSRARATNRADVSGRRRSSRSHSSHAGTQDHP